MRRYSTQVKNVVRLIPGLTWVYRSFLNSHGSFLYHEGNIRYFQDQAIREKLPITYRLFFRFCDVAPRREGRIIGAEIMHRMLIQISKLSRVPQSTQITVGSVRINLLLSDPRSIAIPAEVDASPEVALLTSYLKPGDTFIDVGANHGSYSVVGSKLVGNAGLVVAIEPQLRLAELVEKSMADNATSPYIVGKFACSDKEGAATLYSPTSSSGAAGLVKTFSSWGATRRSTIVTKRFDDVFQWSQYPGQVLMKIDVEGSEIAFLRGAEHAIKALRPPLLIEINRHSQAALGESASNLIQVLADFGYAFYREVLDPTVLPLSTVDVCKQRNILVLFGEA